jgi:hypothetical protein
MDGRARGRSFDGRRWRKPMLIGASMAAHVLVLGVLVVGAIGDRMAVVSPSIVYVEIEPRPLLEGERPRPVPPPATVTSATDALAPTTAHRPLLDFRLPFQRDRTLTEEEQRPASAAPPLALPVPGEPPLAAQAWQVRPENLGDRVARGLRTRGPGCASPQLLSREDRAICEDRFSQQSAAASPISGTGSPERDARFARQGARELADYAERRETRASERAVCEKSGPIADCEVEVSIDLFSSVDGFLPNQRRED